MYTDVAEQAKKLKDASGYYQSFVGKMMGKNAANNCLPVLQYLIGKIYYLSLLYLWKRDFYILIEHGNTTVYEWRYGEPPLRIEEPPLLINVEPEATTAESNDVVCLPVRVFNDVSVIIMLFVLSPFT